MKNAKLKSELGFVTARPSADISTSKSVISINKPVLFEMPWPATASHMLVLCKTTDFCTIPFFHAISPHKWGFVAWAREKEVSDIMPAFCMGPAHQVYYTTLNFISSASRQNFKILFGRFWAIHMRTIAAKFQPSIFKTVGGRHTHGRHALLSMNRNEKSSITRFARSWIWVSRHRHIFMPMISADYIRKFNLFINCFSSSWKAEFCLNMRVKNYWKLKNLLN